MEHATLIDIHVQTRRMYNLLGEVMDLSQQLAEAVDRDDQVAVQMLMSMRAEPIRQLTRTREAIQHQLDSAPGPEQAVHLRALLNGGPAENPAEQALADQVASNDRLLQQVRALDERLSKKIARENSLYK